MVLWKQIEQLGSAKVSQDFVVKKEREREYVRGNIIGFCKLQWRVFLILTWDLDATE